ncbi:hypothetical protein FB473_002374 [Brooklawnia cerclae]|uniref:Uncharacterized protein n=1 Tax=Brooklawnia cerclae TaxID=349934 RepID=A0ABX0SHA3_9ACTN|nr:hypothetical protein [Brooklawnia cerclae]
MTSCRMSTSFVKLLPGSERSALSMAMCDQFVLVPQGWCVFPQAIYGPLLETEPA